MHTVQIGRMDVARRHQSIFSLKPEQTTTKLLFSTEASWSCPRKHSTGIGGSCHLGLSVSKKKTQNTEADSDSYIVLEKSRKACDAIPDTCVRFIRGSQCCFTLLRMYSLRASGSDVAANFFRWYTCL